MPVSLGVDLVDAPHAPGRMTLRPEGRMGIGVTVARLTLNQLVKVRILDPQFESEARPGRTPFQRSGISVLVALALMAAIGPMIVRIRVAFVMPGLLLGRLLGCFFHLLGNRRNASYVRVDTQERSLAV